MAVFGSVFASAYAPKIIRAFGPYPIPAGAKQEAHQSVAAALAVVDHAPTTAQPLLRSSTFSAFGAGFKAACLVGAGAAAAGAVYRSFPAGRNSVSELVEPEPEAEPAVTVDA